MSAHWHTGIDHIIIYGLSAILVINLLRLAAVQLATQPGIFGSIGRSVGALVS